VRQARLLGRDHTHIGSIAAVAEGATALALSAGGAPKRYEHSDVNEDAVGFAVGERGALLLAADAHGGAVAAEAAVAHLLERRAPAWVEGVEGEGPAPAGWAQAAREALWEAHQAVREAAYRPDRQGSRTTLALALVCGGRLFVASLGDSHAFAVDAHGARDLAAPPEPCPPRFWLGSESLTPEQLAERLVAHESPAAGLRCLVLATDGVSERQVGLADPAAATAEAAAAAGAAHPELRALETARGLVERAQAAQRENPSGDNIGVAALWLGEPATAGA
jgi:hypothetical protein